jgi:F-type H+-transporting ATPase subunit gamma
MLVLTSDRGLCGGFNMNICRTTERYYREHVRPTDATGEEGAWRHEAADLLLLGKKGREYFQRRNYPVRREYLDVLVDPQFEQVRAIGDEIIAQYTARELDGVLMVYNEFKSATQQDVVVEQLLPIEADPDEAPSGFGYLFEPNRETLLDNMLTLHVRIQLWRVVRARWARA